MTTLPEGWRGRDDARPLLRRNVPNVTLSARNFPNFPMKANWAASMSIRQKTRIHSEVVAARPKPVAYFLVDAMRFEMGLGMPTHVRRSQRTSRYRRTAEHHPDWHGRSTAWRVDDLIFYGAEDRRDDCARQSGNGQTSCDSDEDPLLDDFC